MRGSFDGVNLYEFECLLTIESIAAGGNSVVKCDVGFVHRAIGYGHNGGDYCNDC